MNLFAINGKINPIYLQSIQTTTLWYHTTNGCFQNVFSLSKQLKGNPFDLIYIDPPYGQGLQEKGLLLIDALELLQEKGALFIEEGIHHPFTLPLLKALILKKKEKWEAPFSINLLPDKNFKPSIFAREPIESLFLKRGIHLYAEPFFLQTRSSLVVK